MTATHLSNTRLVLREKGREPALDILNRPKFGGREWMAGQPFSLADLRTVADALYGRRQWQVELARELNIPPQAIKRWFAGKPLPDIRNLLAALCRRNAADNPSLQKLARKIEKFGPPER